MSWMKAFLDLLYPCSCPGCGRKTEEEAPWCEDCIRLFWHPRLLSRSHSDFLEGCYTCCQYDGALRESILRLKYHGDQGWKGTYTMLLSRFPWWERLTGCSLAVPIPLSRSHEQKRGYNQCDIIFQHFMEERGFLYAPGLLVRLRNTKTQSALTLPERRENIRRAFHCARGVHLKGETVLLLDDVYTTGATMKEAARELRRGGASSVIGLTLASGAL